MPLGFSLHLTVVFLKEPVTYRWSDSQNSTGDEVLVFMSSYIETQMLKTLQASCVFGVQFLPSPRFSRGIGLLLQRVVI